MHTVKSKTGTTYVYAWKGGPRIHSPIGSKAFDRELKRALRERGADRVDTIEGLIRAFMKTATWGSMKPNSRLFYNAAFNDIIDEWGEAPLSLFEERGARGTLLEWRDEIVSDGTPKVADRNLSTLRTLFNFAIDREHMMVNPLARYKPAAGESRRDVIWSDEAVEAFLSAANEPIARAFRLALLTGQRKGDLLKLRWSNIVDGAIRLTQEKTGARVAIPVEGELADLLDSIERVSDYILVTEKGEPWRCIKNEYQKALKAAGLSGLRFHDLRGSFIHRCYRDGMSISDIAVMSGHSEANAEAIIRSAYLPRTAGQDRVMSRQKLTQKVAQDIENYQASNSRTPSEFSFWSMGCDIKSDKTAR